MMKGVNGRYITNDKFKGYLMTLQCKIERALS